MDHDNRVHVFDYGRKHVSHAMPPSPPGSVKSFAEDNLSNVVKPTACESRSISSTELAADWLLKVLAVASAILFGIWAPISYRLQDAGNKNSDEAQDRLMKKIDKLGEEMGELKRDMSGLAALRAFEFCTGEKRQVHVTGIKKAMVKETD
jgi:hypothetical protein